MNVVRPFALAAAVLALAGFAVAEEAEPPVVAEPGGFRAFWNSLANADGSSDVISVSSQTYNGYKRTRLTDGNFRPETYAFAEGGYGGSTAAGQPAEKVPFLKIARTIAGPLATQAYVPTKSADTTDLMILVFWGITEVNTSPDNGFATGVAPTMVNVPPPITGPQPPGAPIGPTESPTSNPFGEGADSMMAFQSYWRDKANFRNARILGYAQEFGRVIDNFALRDMRTQLVSDLEDPRYYVVLQAYDFPKARNEKRLVLLWSTRFSIRERRNDFDRDLAAMTRRAARFFGQDSHGLQRDLSFRGSVDIGELKVIEFDPQAVREIDTPESAPASETPEQPKR